MGKAKFVVQSDDHDTSDEVFVKIVTTGVDEVLSKDEKYRRKMSGRKLVIRNFIGTTIFTRDYATMQ